MPAAIELSQVRFDYPDGTPALSSVDLTVPDGGSLALLGPNGAGKSTLLLHLGGVLRPASGEVRICGVPVTHETVREVRSMVGMVFQDPDDQLFMTTLYDDVAFGPLNMRLDPAEVDRRVNGALQAVELADEASRPAQHLSFGQRKRAALATVLSMSPAVLVLDEPTSNLDPRARAEMIGLLASLASAKIVATHDMDLASSLCELAAIMDGGRIVASGPIGEILADSSLLLEHGLEAPADRCSREDS